KDRTEAQLLNAAAGLGDRVVDSKRRYHAGADELAWIGLAEFMEPVVVGARESGGEFTIQIRNAEHVQAAARIENREIDAFFRHYSSGLNFTTFQSFHRLTEKLKARSICKEFINIWTT